MAAQTVSGVCEPPSCAQTHERNGPSIYSPLLSTGLDISRLSDEAEFSVPHPALVLGGILDAKHSIPRFIEGAQEGIDIIFEDGV